MNKPLFAILLFLLPWSLLAQHYDHTTDVFGVFQWEESLIRVDTVERNWSTVSSYRDSTHQVLSAISDKNGLNQLNLVQLEHSDSATGRNVYGLWIYDSDFTREGRIGLEMNNIFFHTPIDVMFVPSASDSIYYLFVSNPIYNYYNQWDSIQFYYYKITLTENAGLKSEKVILSNNTCYNVAAIPFEEKNGFWIITQTLSGFEVYGMNFNGDVLKSNSYKMKSFIPPAEVLRTSVSGKSIAIAYGAHRKAKLAERQIINFDKFNFNAANGEISKNTQTIKLNRYDADYLRNQSISNVSLTDLDDLQFLNHSDDTLVTLIQPRGQGFAGILTLDFKYDFTRDAYPAALSFKLLSLGTFRRNNQGDISLAMISSWSNEHEKSVDYYTANIRDKITNSFRIDLQNKLGSDLGIVTNNLLVESNQLFIYHKLQLEGTQTCDSSINFHVDLDTTFFSRFEIVVNQQDTIQEDELKYYVNKEGWVELELLAYTPWNYMRKTSKMFFVSSLLFKPSAKLILEDTIGCEWLGFRVENNSKVEFKGTEVVFDLSFGDKHDTTLNTFSYFHHIYNQSGTYPISLIVDDGYCQDTFVSLQDVEILEAPQPGLSLSQDTACFPDPLFASYVHDDLVDSIEYAWGDGLTSTTFNKDALSHVYNDNTLKTYQVIQKLYGPTGCVVFDSAEFKVFEGFPDFPIVLKNVSVIDNQNIEVSWDDYQGAVSYNLYLEGTVVENLEDNSWLYKLDSVNRSYGFQVQAINHCNTLSFKSPGLYTNYLQADVDEQNKYAKLFWNPNLPWEDSVGRTGVELLKQGSYVELSSLDPNDQEYFDYQFSNNSNGLFSCYRMYTEHIANPSLRSYSNVVCPSLMPFWYVPTAFSPNGDGVNDTYSIFTTGIPVVRFAVYNRWGEKIFETNGNLWDGSYNGNVVNSGVYLIKYEIIQNSGVSIYGSEVLTVLE
ncbi:T9SS type B sorting domain-containing protein [bacterium]|nr:T9SS type B sorting domain-containing protein [bacterium]